MRYDCFIKMVVLPGVEGEDDMFIKRKLSTK